MNPVPAVTSDLPQLWSARLQPYAFDHRVMDELVSLYNGQLPDEFMDFFHEDQHIHLVNMVRLAWDDLANMAGKVFQVKVNPDNDKPTARERAALQEYVAMGYNDAGNRAGGISMKMLMKVLCWWLVGCGNAVAMVLPCYDEYTPFFTWRDPRTYYPPVGSSPFNQRIPEDALFAYQLSLAEIKLRWPERTAELNQAYQKFTQVSLYSNSRLNDDQVQLWVGEYYHKDTWMVSILEDKAVTLTRSDTGDTGHPNIMPVVPMQLFNGAGTKGRSMFADQISIQAAMSRMFSQKLDSYDRTLYPLIFTTPLSHKALKIGPFALNEYDTTNPVAPKTEVVGPTTTIDAEQTLSFVMGMTRMLNRNPEQMQGAGPADSAKALTQLQSAVADTVKEGIWPPMLEAIPSMYEKAALMDEQLWGNERKHAGGRNRPMYVPNAVLRGREKDFYLTPGIGLAGYQGSMELMQLYGAEFISLPTVLEEGDWTDEPERELRRIQLDRLEKLAWATLENYAASGQIMPDAISKLMKLTGTGMDLFDAIDQLQTQGGLVQPPPELQAGMAGGLPGGPGGPAGNLPPGAAGAAGVGPAASFLPLPTLGALRGGPGSIRKPNPAP